MKYFFCALICIGEMFTFKKTNTIDFMERISFKSPTTINISPVNDIIVRPLIITIAVSGEIIPTPTIQEVKDEIVNVFGYNQNALCVANAESGDIWWQKNHNTDYYFFPDGSWDIGIFEVNINWHPEVNEMQMLDYRQNIQKAYEISNGGTDWSSWALTTRQKCGLA